ncbi:peptidyl-prolyl cis-trans isomerase B (cyclophilin B) [Bacilli bacterium PM5-3]|nr:peptidyl-prolyl cis-trans isomerase B (cyclophilin B) [Bacilli bacterium PM5-3]MDH6603955.1 peptidyl-prolyl cis-trans isomerase B (cyclophilin B) [Bacilli bacterium PM5-9]
MKKIIKLSMVLLCLVVLSSCSSNEKFDCEANKYEKNPIATIKVKGYGTMKFELYVNKAPQSVANFIELANSKFYDGLTFHRLDQDLAIIQGGDPSGNGSGGPGYSIKGEFVDNNHCNDLMNEKGTIAMARSQENDSGGSQFYINFKNNTNIFRTGYAVFGKIIDGEDLLTKFDNTKTKEANGTNVPDKPIYIETIRVETFNQDMPEIDKIK